MITKEISEKIRSAMIAHLETKGFPDMSYDEILAECPNMWRKLEEENLIQRGWKYEHFLNIAVGQKESQEILDLMKDLGGGFRRTRSRVRF